MQLVHRASPALRGCVLTMGSFDGVHRAHQLILARVVELARQRGARAGLLTFDPPPPVVFHPEFLYLLTTRDEKRARLAASGLDFTYEMRFDRTTGALDAEVFFERQIADALAPRVLVVGRDHRFGAGRRGDLTLLTGLARARDVELEVVEPVRIAGSTVSSTRIREKLLLGNVRLAARLLGRPYDLTSSVGRGAGRGRGLGFPTVNLEPPAPEKLIPADGVYAVEVGHASWCRPGVMNIGTRPTFGGDQRGLEVHILDHAEQLYGARLTVHFIERLREERRFPTPAALAAQVARDVARAREVLAARPRAD